MRSSTAFVLAAIGVVPTMAAPAAGTAKSMMAANTAEWTIEMFKRTCNANSTSCDYSYFIDTHTANATPCSYTIHGSPAENTDYNGIKCGSYTVSSGWSGQFGPGNGFSTLSVTDGTNIIYPAYSDRQLVNGTAVSPDQSYAPQALPKIANREGVSCQPRAFFSFMLYAHSLSSHLEAEETVSFADLYSI